MLSILSPKYPQDQTNIFGLLDRRKLKTFPERGSGSPQHYLPNSLSSSLRDEKFECGNWIEAKRRLIG